MEYLHKCVASQQRKVKYEGITAGDTGSYQCYHYAFRLLWNILLTSPFANMRACISHLRNENRNFEEMEFYYRCFLHLLRNNQAHALREEMMQAGCEDIKRMLMLTNIERVIKLIQNPHQECN
ncbi:hypothetical protein LOAG_12080 [Loa loa]|uniref:Uncharacterized protein n=1 Tax=Loa loa TaxID=7209 RepID=A0A1S0TN16_LOALO|nr:hypothetical protein LOAG_12080 [Loa loa]EFO16427.1 hypothetical protein LOAG_12080 [Loa loa]